MTIYVTADQKESGYSVLAVIELPAYQDYIIRSKVSEGMVFATEVKTSASARFYLSNRSMPNNNSEAGLPAPTDYDVHDHIHRLDVLSSDPRAGTIQITFKINGLGDKNLLHLVPATSAQSGQITWTCEPPDSNGIKITRVPPICRGR